jgi:hypothetical protein
MDKNTAIASIKAVFAAYKAGKYAPNHGDNQGKVYELYCLSRVIERLKKRGFNLRLIGNGVAFKAKGGMIKTSDPCFEFWSPLTPTRRFRLWTDIQFWSLGSSQLSTPTKKSGLHELDIVAVPADFVGYPQFTDLALGVECKSNASFEKWILKQALGVRREMSLLSDPRRSALSCEKGVRSKKVPANPPSEFWLTFCDPGGLDYRFSAETFGIEFLHWQP